MSLKRDNSRSKGGNPYSILYQSISPQQGNYEDFWTTE
ncbi:unnamed protein product [Paramecium octaurelia]|uniref:Uncharacterized protein n=1 Tax=Paramecium octaurelia TaxID=43137 RepID=A0A8S1WSX7_PAROT|nr:unnamed protein product [Paramecium octaurelia]